MRMLPRSMPINDFKKKSWTVYRLRTHRFQDMAFALNKCEWRVRPKEATVSNVILMWH